VSDDAPCGRGKRPARRARRKIFPYLALSGLVLFGAIFVGHMILKPRGARELEAAFTRARAMGVAVSRDELEAKLPNPADDENAGNEYWRAMRMADEYDGPDKLLFAFVQGYPNIANHPNAPGEPWRPWPAESVSAARDFADANREALEMLTRGALKSECRYHWLPKGPFDSFYDKPRSFRRCVQLLTFAAIAAAEDGEGPAALQRLDECLALCESPRNDSNFIITMMGFTGRSSALYGLERVLARASFDDESLAAFQKRLANAAARIEPAAAIEAEMVETIEFFRLLREGNAEAAGFVYGKPGILNRLKARLTYAGADADAAAYTETVLDLLQALREQDASSPGFALPPPSMSRLYQGRYRMSAMVADGIYSFPAQCNRMRARLLCASAAVAALRFRNDNGRWPATLDELVGKYIDAVPTDPVTGASLLFTAGGNSLSVYSTGPDGKDNGGDLEDDDVFRLLLGPEEEADNEAP
jgi:hypothetical protein